MEQDLAWAILGLTLVIVELLTGTFYLLMLGIAAFGAAVAAYFGFEFPAQAMVAGAVAVAGCFGVHAYRARNAAQQMQPIDAGQPASFESDVILKDDSTGSRREVNISMNRPLQHRGFRVFQSGYQQPEGGPEISIFSVAKDPGIPLKYAGSIILVLGTLLMFYTRKFSNQGQGSFSKSKGVLVS